MAQMPLTELIFGSCTCCNIGIQTLRMQTRHIEVWGQKEEEEDNEDEQVRIVSGWDGKRWSMVRVTRQEGQTFPRQSLSWFT